MNASNARDYLPLVQALAEGKTIEYRDSDDAWIDCESPSFNQHSSRYRIKPEPPEASIQMAKILEEFAADIRSMKIDAHELVTTADWSGTANIYKAQFIYTVLK